MSRKRREYDDDDGRTIADMSGLSGQNLFVPHISGDHDRSNAVDDHSSGNSNEQKGIPTLSSHETRWAILGALKAAILIYLPFLIGLGAVIAFMYFFW